MKTLLKIVALFALCLVCVAALLGAGKSESNIAVKAVWIYPFENGASGSFSNATVMEKTGTGIKFKVADRVYEHCGHYTIEN